MVAMQLKLISKCYITFIRFGCRLHHASGGSMKSCRRGRSDVTSATRRARVILEEGTDGSQTKSGGKCELITSFGCHLFFSQRQLLEQLPALPSTVNSAWRAPAPSSFSFTITWPNKQTSLLPPPHVSQKSPSKFEAEGRGGGQAR